MFRVISGIFLGWALGANDSANVFGTAVSSRMIRYLTAVFLTALFVVIGALLQGHEGMHTLGSLTTLDLNGAFIASMAAAVTVTIMTVLKLPISTSQAVVGSILGIGIMSRNINLSGLYKVLICWVGTPIGGFVFALIIYVSLRFIYKKVKPNIFITDSLLKIGLILAGCYGAYALGANNVANVTGVYAGNLLTSWQAVLIGGVAIAIGAVTYSRKVMMTVGKSIVKLDAFSAFVAVVAHSLTVHIYALIGVPVSTSQAIVGAVLAIGFVQGVHSIQFSTLARVLSGWVLTPVISSAISIVFYVITHLQYVA
jgi:PiT family inorganic phosphate transporter